MGLGGFIGLVESFVRSPRKVGVFFTAVTAFGAMVATCATIALASAQINIQRAKGISVSIATRECHKRERAWQMGDSGHKIMLCAFPDADCMYTFPQPRFNVSCSLTFHLVSTGPGGVDTECNTRLHFNGSGNRMRYVPRHPRWSCNPPTS